MSRILVIEDNATLARGLADNLAFEGHTVAVAHSAAEGSEQATIGAPELIILDLMLPDGDGYRLLRDLRERAEPVAAPVLILSALGEEADKVRGFRFGADDYVTKPFGLMELLARVEALLRRAGQRAPAASPAVHRFGDITIDEGTRVVVRGRETVSLRPKELALLMALVRRNGALATRMELLREVWGYDDSVMSRTVDTHVAELRRKLERDPARPIHLVTVLKAGYRWSAVTGP